MAETAIQVENLSKKYDLGTAAGYKTIRESFYGIFQRDEVPKGEEFWALRDVSFEVKRGEVVGVIGRNGAGKSTLLKILSRITKPTVGSADVYGRVGSLLEVGTGFHPELTGRENIFLNGAILGMTRRDIQLKFDEIVDFSEVCKFLDTPVKRYSSGMYVRLAFAVAAHLEPDILIIDEVLAVGDATFQRKCIGKMDGIAEKGRTVLFVSHNMGIINQLCPVTMWLDNGKVKEIGATPQVISNYLMGVNRTISDRSMIFELNDNKLSQLIRIRLLNTARNESDVFDCSQRVTIELSYLVRRKVRGIYGYLQIMRTDQTVVMVSDSFDCGNNPMDNLSPGEHTIKISIPERTLAPGEYYVYLNFTNAESQGENIDSPGIVARFQLNDVSSKRGNQRGGYFSTLLNWELASD